MPMIWTALITMIVSVLMQHLGLTEAIAAVIHKIARCHKCCAFWATLAALVYLENDILVSFSLSIFMAYLSNYFGLLLILLMKVYNKLWEKIQR